MPKKKTDTEMVIEKIFDYTLEDIMGERFGSYSKYIIQDRAIPDARDGLKPVQRRILYSMHKEHNTYDKGYRKSAKHLSMMLWFVCHSLGKQDFHISTCMVIMDQ